MKRTTIVLEDDLFRRIKQEAARQGETLKSYLNALLRKALIRPREAKPYKFEWKPKKGILRKDIDYANHDLLYEIMEGRR